MANGATTGYDASGVTEVFTGDLPVDNAMMIDALSAFTDEEILFELAKRKKDPIPKGAIHARSFLWGAGTTAAAMFLSRLLRGRR